MEIYKIIQAFLWPQLFCCLIALIIVFLIYFIITAGKTHDFSRGMRGGAPYYKYHGAKKVQKTPKTNRQNTTTH